MSQKLLALGLDPELIRVLVLLAEVARRKEKDARNG